jgi:hypothetical protein
VLAPFQASLAQLQERLVVLEEDRTRLNARDQDVNAELLELKE